MTNTIVEESIDIETAERFLRLFEPNPSITGFTKLLPGKDKRGKQDSDSWSKSKQPNAEGVIAHFQGELGLGLAPIWKDGTAKFGAIDVDVYGALDHAAIAQQLAAWELPLWVCKTKSGGAHIYIFMEERVSAEALTGYLSNLNERLRSTGLYQQEREIEIFPKQSELREGSSPSWINLPYFDLASGMRPCVDAMGQELSLEEFVERVEFDGLVAPEDVAAFLLNSVVPTRTKTAADVEVDDWTAALDRIGRNYPNDTGRSEAATYLAGGLLRAGWDTKSTQAFIDALHTRIGDNEIHDRQHIAAMTASKLEDGREVAGWPKLAGVIGWEAVEDTCVLLDIRPLPLSVARIEERVKGGFADLDKLADLIARAAFNGNDLKACTQIIASETGTTAAIVRAKIDAALSQAASSTGQDIVDELNAQFAHVTVGDSPRIIWERPGERYELIRKNALIDRYAGHKALIPGRGWVNKGDFWFNHSQRRQYDRKVFKPGVETPGDYNTWRGFRFEPSPDGSWDLLREHLLENVAGGNQQHALWIFAWFAQLMQRPMEKTGTALVLLGRQGTGKTIIGKVFGDLIRDHYMLAEDSNLVVGNFNHHMEDTLLLHADEAIFAKDRKVMARLRGLVTAERQTYEPKGVNAYSAPNYTRILITTQQNHAVEVNLDERRFAVFEIESKRQQDIEFFGAMLAELKNGGYERLLYDLLEFDFSAVDLRRIPITEATLDQAAQSLDDVTRFVFEVLENGSMPHETAYDYDETSWATRVEKTSFYKGYVAWAKGNNMRYVQGQASFYKTWKEFFPSDVIKGARPRNVTFMHGPRGDRGIFFPRVYVLIFKPLNDMRDLFTKATKIAIQFDEDSPAAPVPKEEDELADRFL